MPSPYKGIPTKSTKPLRAGFSETRLSSVQTIQPTHTKPATDRENKVRTAKLQPVFAAAVGAADLDGKYVARFVGPHSQPLRQGISPQTDQAE